MEVSKVRVAMVICGFPILRNPDMEGPDGWDMNHSNHLEIQGKSAVIVRLPSSNHGELFWIFTIKFLVFVF